MAIPDAHYETTGQEIVEVLPDLDMFVAGLGTGGTLMGVGRRLKEHNPQIKVVAVAPEPEDFISGSEGPRRRIHTTDSGHQPTGLQNAGKQL